jgi:hypothetical protein
MMGMQYFPEEDITVVMTTNIGDVFSSKTTDLFDHELLLDILAVTFLGTRN